jgi:hypothetical protein
LYAGVAALGYAFGAHALPSFGGSGRSTALARVGFALSEQRLNGDAADWAALRADVAAVRAPMKQRERGVFELLVALRGLENAGKPDFAKAAELCRSLAWRRCDQAALDELLKRSRP